MKRVKCSTCPAVEWRVRKSKHVSCRKCKNVLQKKKRQRNPEKYAAACKAWRLANPEKALACSSAWRKRHPKIVSIYNRRAHRKYLAKQKLLNKEVVDSLPCLDCGVSHAQERRIAVIARVLPCESEEIREAWPCFWQDASGKDAGYQRLLRDLKKMGASLNGRLWQIASRRAA